MKKIVIVMLLIMMCIVTCCTRVLVVDKQSQYHELTEDLEKYVLYSLSEYIVFDEPVIKEDFFYCNVTFVSGFATDAEEYDYIVIMEETRLLINEYLDNNKEYFLNDLYVVFHFYKAPKVYSTGGTMPYEKIGQISNRNGEEDTDVFISYVNYDYINSETITALHCEDIEEIDLSKKINYDEVLTIVDSLPNLREVEVYSEYKDKLLNDRPDIIVR